jgi:hypothetical protein
MKTMVRSVAAAFAAAAALWIGPPFQAEPRGQDRQEPGSQRRLVLKGPVPRTPDGKIDLRGRWDAPPLFNSNIIEEHPAGFGIQAGKSVIIDPPDGKLPYQPWALAERERRRRPENAYEDNEGRCFPSGVPRIMLFTFEIAYSPGYIVLLYEYVHTTRLIRMNGPHLPGPFRLWMGDSVGRWEGDTLVVDTTGLTGKTWMALGGDFLTEAAHIVERFTMPDPNTLTWQATIDDPKAYTRPFTMQTAAPYRRGEPEEMIDETCHEGNADLVHLKNNYDRAREGK